MEQLLFAALILFYFFAPMGILYLCHKYPFVNKIGAVLLAYVLGIIIGNTGLLVGDEVDRIQEIMMSVTIPLAIPMILYSSDIKKSFQLAKTTFLSLLSAIIGLTLVIFLGYYIFHKPDFESFYKVGGLLMGVYTGGTPNLAALKMVLDVEPGIYISVHTYDMVLSTLHLFFLILFGKKVFEWVLPAFRDKQYIEQSNVEEIISSGEDPYWGLLQKGNIVPILKALGITIGIAVIGGGLMMIMPEKSQMAVFILTITSLALIASSFKKVKNLPKTYEAGMYLILIFSVVVASKAHYKTFTEINPYIFYYVTFVVFASLVMHVVLAKVFKVDADTVIVTSAALICSPPFVPVVAGAIHNKSMIIPGITVGIVGYAIGNFLGYLVAQVLQFL